MTLKTNWVDGDIAGDPTPGSIAVGALAAWLNEAGIDVNDLLLDIGTNPQGTFTNLVNRLNSIENRLNIIEGGIPLPGGDYTVEVTNDAPSGYWKLAEASGTTAAAQIGTLAGTYLSTGHSYAQVSLTGQDFSHGFDGVNSGLSFADTPVTDLGDNFTLECAFRRDSIDSADMIYYQSGGGPSLLITALNRIVLGTGGSTKYQSTVLIVDSLPHHLMVTKNGADVHIYLDGVDVTDTTTFTSFTPVSGTTLFVGQDSAAGQKFQGLLDELAVYKTALTAARAKAHSDAMVRPDVLWTGDFEESSGGGPSSDVGTTTLNDLYAPSSGATGNYGGGEYNSNGGTTARSTAQAKSGASSAILTLPIGGAAGTRIFRWGELRAYRELSMEGWYWLPSELSLVGPDKYWIIQEIKSRNGLAGGAARNDPFWYWNLVHNTSGKARKLRMTWGAQSGLAGPTSSDGVAFKNFDTTVEVPIATWFKLRMVVKQSKDFDGYIKGYYQASPTAAEQLLINQPNVRTGYADAVPSNTWGVKNDWACTSYSDGLSNGSAYGVHVDDEKIALP